MVFADRLVVSAVRTLTVSSADDNLRLDRWFKKHFPDIGHGHLQKLLRTGQIRLDGARAKSGSRVREGQNVRVPPLTGNVSADGRGSNERTGRRIDIDPKRAAELLERVLHCDRDVLIIDKPAGLAVQGGSGLREHLDGYLDTLRLDADERPRLVHRLDKDTSGVLVLARTGAAARWLTEAFRRRDTRKLYWAVVVGVPSPEQGVIDAALEKGQAGVGEKMRTTEPGEGLGAKTVYQVVSQAGRIASWLAMEPLTGRTHQLRVHAAEVLGTPVLGDGKYGGAHAYLDSPGVSRDLHLHARRIKIPTPGGGAIEVCAPVPAHMAATFKFFGFEEGQAGRDFLDPGAQQ